MTTFLEAEGLTKDFGGFHAVDNLSLALGHNELLCIIGPNGCGKTTLFNLITGALRPSAGTIRLFGESIAGLAPHRISRKGVARKFQVPGIYPDLTVLENLAVPLFGVSGQKGLRGLLDRDKASDRTAEILARVRLSEKRNTLAGALSHGEKQWLEIGMVLASQPRLILLDEPTAGMTVGETDATASLILDIHRETSVGIVVIEHDMSFVRKLGCPVAVMMQGRILRQGSLEEVSADPMVQEAYLGGAT